MFEKFENFEILKELGKGGMGIVYLAREKILDRSVALKIIRKELLNNPTVVKRFEREAQAAARLRHQNIVQIYSIGNEKGIHYTVMEYVDGKGLDMLIKEQGFFSVEQAVDIVLQVAGALMEAHSRNIIHRDIKPSNILIDSLGRVTVTDFGLARIRDLPGVTQDGELLGTPEYMSPERTKELGLNPESDIYSLGVVFYEILTGSVPFLGNNPYQTLKKHCQEKPVDPDKLNPKVPGQLVKIINKMLAKNPEDRYRNVKELIADLEQFKIQMENQTVQLSSPGAGETLSSSLINWVQGNRKIFLSAGLFMLIFFCLKYLYVDPIKNYNENIDAAPFNIETSSNKDININFPGHPNLEAFAQMRSIQFALLVVFTLGVAFWFWMLVDCLSTDNYPEKGIFSGNYHLDRIIWLVLFITLNIVAAILYKVLITKYRREVNS